MSFVRAKEIPPGSGNWYDYEVMGVRNHNKVRQRHIQYLGKHGGKLKPLIGSSGFAGHRFPANANTDIATPSPAPEPTTPMADTTNIPKMKTPARLIASALGMYYGGMPLDAIEQQFKQDHDLDMSESNYWNWVKRFTKEAIKQAKDFKPDVGDYWVADETYMKLGKRKVYFWDIIDEKTRYLIASYVTTRRGATEAQKLMELAKERAGKSPKYVITDKLASYIEGVEQAFGADSKHIRGGPFKSVEDNESTARIERFHKTLEQRTKVFEKFKDLASIKLLTDGWLINYNFFKQHEGVGNIPPAQAMSKVVPFKDWNDIVRPDSLPDVDYKVSLHRRTTVKKGSPVVDATLTPVPSNKEIS